MDISIIKTDLVNDLNGIKIGSEQAPKKIIEFVNLRCPFCKQWFEESYEVLSEAVATKKVQRIIKLLDKDKASLQRGNIMHEYISSDPEKTLDQLRQAFDTQEIWGSMTLEQVAQYAEEQLHLKQQPTQAIQNEIRNEAALANVRFVPSVFIDQHIFDESITQKELLDYLDM
ncbi:thioredoxin [Enterococcus florum]|uniref:Thioredoxin n=1 Tax=Enterococcus florum TaxID=2480627 RepID=A0A4V0WPN5_9ENTE|nr:thioredoxin domain-containing protein [Enterococcus florum]GCF94479.1 thioredoxin [Enterococcus florum]